MANSLTGDFDAVLQVSGATVNRLVATMHQNGSVDAARPSLPHVAYFRIGGPGDSERGSVAAQIGVPHVSLINGAFDRFRLEFGFRANYRADPGSTPLADIIRGTVRAEYRVQNIDPNCPGWRRIASDYLWLRVVEDSVSFEGTASDETSGSPAVSVIDEPVVNTLIARHLAGVLAHQFAPTPQPINKPFRRLCSLASGASAPSAIAVPFGLNGDAPAGSLASIDELFVGSRDFALAISGDSIVSAIQPKLDPVIGLQRDFHVHGDAGVGGGLEIDYHARVDSASAMWLGPLVIPFVNLSGGVLRLRMSGVGWASRLYRSGVFNLGAMKLADLSMTFSVEQLLLLDLDVAAERLTVSALGTPVVSPGYGGPFADRVVPMARDAIGPQVQGHLAGVLAQAQTELGTLTAPERKRALIEQLRSIDGAADARFDEAVFRPEGLVLRGVITLTPRQAPHPSFAETDAADGFDAIESWIPGGQVDAFTWTWRWFTNPMQGSTDPPGSATREESFLLRRPQAQRNKFGMTLSREKPLPGLDGPGAVCLSIKGTHVDHVTGLRVPTESRFECAHFGYEFRAPVEVGPYLRVCDPVRATVVSTEPEIGILRVGVSEPGKTASNTLVLYLDESWDERAASTLKAGLEKCHRADAGLLVLVLFRDGALRESDDRLQARLRALASSLPAPMLVSEDVREGWSKILSLPMGTSESVWRLIDPAGQVTWAHDRRSDAASLASMLDRRLVSSPPARAARVRDTISREAPFRLELVDRSCPPVPLSRHGTAGVKLAFVQNGRASSLARLQRLQRAHSRQAEDVPSVAVVVDGADREQAEALRADLAVDWPIFADPTGAITLRAGVRFAPTVITLDGRGIVTEFDVNGALGDGQLKPREY